MMNQRVRRHARGTILIVAMGVLLILAGFTLVVCRQMRIEAIASANYVAAAEAGAIERAAEQYAIAQLVDQKEAVLTLPETQFAAQPVGSGYFWIVRPNYDDDQLPTFGLVDEASKLNVNGASEAQLELLPGMDPDIADAIVAWRGSNAATAGMDDSYYLSLSEPYQSKSARLETVEELALIRGMTRQLLYGQPSASQSAIVLDRQLLRGIADLVTVYSVEPNVSVSGTTRVNVSNLSDSNLQRQLRANLSNAIGASRANAIMARINPRSPRFSSRFDFLRSTSVAREDRFTVFDLISTSNAREGMVNVNTAPRDVLLCLSGLGEDDVDLIIAQRGTQSLSNPADITWLMDVLPSDKLNAIGNSVTGRSAQYSADIVAISGNGRSFKRCRIVIDTSSTTLRVVYRRDISDRGFPLDGEILTSLRQGSGLPAIASSPQARRSL